MSPQHPVLVCRSATGGLFQLLNNWAEPRVVLPVGGMRPYQKTGKPCLLPAPRRTTAPRSGELVETALPGDSGVFRASPSTLTAVRGVTLTGKVMFRYR